MGSIPVAGANKRGYAKRALSYWLFTDGGIEPLGSECRSGGAAEPSGPEPVEGGEFDSRCGCQTKA